MNHAAQTLPEQAMTAGSLLYEIDPSEFVRWASFNLTGLRAHFFRLGYERQDWPLFIRVQYVYRDRLLHLHEPPAPVSTLPSPCGCAQDHQELGPASGLARRTFP